MPWGAVSPLPASLVAAAYSRWPCPWPGAKPWLGITIRFPLNLHEIFTRGFYRNLRIGCESEGCCVSAIGFARIMVDRQETGRTLPDVNVHRIKVETRNVCFWYGKTQALFDVATAIPERCVTALI